MEIWNTSQGKNMLIFRCFEKKNSCFWESFSKKKKKKFVFSDFSEIFRYFWQHGWNPRFGPKNVDFFFGGTPGDDSILRRMKRFPGGVNSVCSVTACRLLLASRMALPAVPHNPIERSDYPPNESNRRPLLDQIGSTGEQGQTWPFLKFYKRAR